MKRRALLVATPLLPVNTVEAVIFTTTTLVVVGVLTPPIATLAVGLSNVMLASLSDAPEHEIKAALNVAPLTAVKRAELHR